MKKKYLFLLLIVTLSYYHPLRGKEIKISFTGDIIMHNPVKRSAYAHNRIDPVKKISLNNRGFDFLFERIKDSFAESDIVVGNMEFPILPPYKSGNMIFNCNPAVLPALKKAGFTMMTIANNHILDQGGKGLLNTIKELKTHKFDFIGTETSEIPARSGVILSRNGIKIGFIGYTGILNYPVPKNQKIYYLNRFYITDKVKEDIKNVKMMCDYLIMNIHTGEEYRPQPLKKDVSLMKEYLNHGVDLIIGHHPHILQPAEQVISEDGRECYIFYSLGNFISNQSGKVRYKPGGYIISTRDSAIINLFLSRENSIIKCRFEVLPIMTLNIFNKKNRQHTIQTIPINDEIILLNGKRINATKKERTIIDKKIKKLSYKTKIIKKIIFRNRVIDKVRIIGDPEEPSD